MESFKVLDINEAIPKGYRMAKFKDIVDLEHLRSVLGRDKTWYICRLQDGKVAGPGYGYEIIKQQPDTGLGHKLLVKTLHSGEKVLYVEERDRPPPNQFQLAEVTDIVRLDMLKDALFDKTWHICKFTDGHVMGPGYGYLVKQMPYRDGIGHKLVVGPSEAAEALKSIVELSNERPKFIKTLREIAAELRSEKFSSNVASAVSSGTAVLGYFLMGVAVIGEVASVGTATEGAVPLFAVGEGLAFAGNLASLIASIISTLKKSSELKKANEIFQRDHDMSVSLLEVHKKFDTRFPTILSSAFRRASRVGMSKFETNMTKSYTKMFKASEKLPCVALKTTGIIIGAGMSIWDLVSSMLNLAKGSPSIAADMIDKQADKMEEALQRVNEQLQTTRKLLYEELREGLSNQPRNWLLQAEIVMDNILICNVNPLWDKNNDYGMSTSTFVSTVLKPLLDKLKQGIERESKKSLRHGEIELALVAHGAVGRPLSPHDNPMFDLIPTIIPTQFYFLTDSLRSVTFYQPWGCMLHANAAYRIVTQTMNPGLRQFYEGNQYQNDPHALGDVFMESGAIPNSFNKLQNSTVPIPTVWLHPFPQADPALEDLRNLLRLRPAPFMLFCWTELPATLPACVVTNALALIASMLHVELKIHMVCCLGIGDLNRQTGLGGLLSVTQYSNLLPYLTGSRAYSQIWMATGTRGNP